jgi:hypothetical protein
LASLEVAEDGVDDAPPVALGFPGVPAGAEP